MVDLLGCYSNSPHLLETLSSLLDLPDAIGRGPLSARRQHQMRLNKVYQTQLVEAYRAGSSVYKLVAQFGVTRQTAAAILGRHGIKRRYNVLSPEMIELATTQYGSGESLATIGVSLRVDPGTVRKALLKSGVHMRPVGTNQWS